MKAEGGIGLLEPMVPWSRGAYCQPRPNRNMNNVALGRVILSRVAEYYGQEVGVILSRCRTDDVAWARALAIELCMLAGLGFEAIGRVANRDRTVVGHNRLKVWNYIEQYPDLAEDRERLAKEFVAL